jgi:predicted Zn-dependent protease with MMP-like domain
VDEDLLAEISGLIDDGEPEEALRLLAKARKKAPPELAAELALLEASAHNALGDWTAALRAATEAQAALGGVADVLYEKGTALFELCRFEEARDALREAARDSPDDPFVLHALGLVLEQTGDEAGADRALRRARKLAPDDFPQPVELTAAEFDRAIHDALGELPPEIRTRLEELTISVKPIPDLRDLREHEGDHPLSPASLGLFRGASLRHRTGSGELPPAIFLFQKNLERFAEDRDDLVEQIRITVLHEVGHYLGFDEDDLHDRGLE